MPTHYALDASEIELINLFRQLEPDVAADLLRLAKCLAVFDKDFDENVRAFTEGEPGEIFEKIMKQVEH